MAICRPPGAKYISHFKNISYQIDAKKLFLDINKKFIEWCTVCDTGIIADILNSLVSFVFWGSLLKRKYYHFVPCTTQTYSLLPLLRINCIQLTLPGKQLQWFMVTTVANIRVISLNEYAPVWAGPTIFIGSMFILPISNMQFYGLNYNKVVLTAWFILRLW